MPEGWSQRVAFSEDGGFAYVPGELFVPRTRADEAGELLSQRQDSGVERERLERGSFDRFLGVVDPVSAVDDLRDVGIVPHLNHVLFAHGHSGWGADGPCCCGASGQCGCGPHPAMLWPQLSWAGQCSSNPYSSNPFSSNPFSSNPFSSNPFSSNPFSSNPFSSNPFSSNPFSSNPFSSNPFSSNPYSASDFQPNPLYLPAASRLGRDSAEFRSTGWRPHSAHPATAPVLPDRIDREEVGPNVVVIDTGLARPDLFPHTLAGVLGDDHEAPDEDADDRIDPVAGHGTFIAGIIKRIAPKCRVRVLGPVDGYGDVSEHAVATTLESLPLSEGRPDLVNMSFGGYAVSGMARLREAVRKLQSGGTVVVASAGNDATCRPAFPAALPGVVSVGAVGPGGPAHFTNYGPWVRACAPGVDVVSTFFTKWESPIGDGEKYAEWVRWSGTSFAAPAVVGALARAMADGLTGAESVARLIDDPDLLRIPGLGTVVNQSPWWRPSRP